jgi:hypothetical protein
MEAFVHLCELFPSFSPLSFSISTSLFSSFFILYLVSPFLPLFPSFITPIPRGTIHMLHLLSSSHITYFYPLPHTALHCTYPSILSLTPALHYTAHPPSYPLTYTTLRYTYPRASSRGPPSLLQQLRHMSRYMGREQQAT